MTSMFDDDLIENVKKYPILYKVKSKNYKNIISKGNCWIKIGAAMNKSPEECKSKWRNIRDNYLKNKKKKSTNGSSSFSKYDDERLNFLSEAYDEVESVNNVDNNSSFCIEGVKEEFDSSEDVPLSESPFIAEITNDIVNLPQHSAATFMPDVMTATYETNQSELTAAQQNIRIQDVRGHPKPRRAMKRKIDSIIDEIKKDREERNLILQQLVTNATNRVTQQSPIHNFFSSMADIVSGFPPDRIAEVRVKICSLISEMELSVLREKSQSNSRSRPEFII